MEFHRHQNFIAGRWVDAQSGERHPVIDPADGSRITDVAASSAADAALAVEAARSAFPGWARLSSKERAVVLKRWHALILEHREALGRIVSREQGKPLAEAIGEVTYGAQFVEWFAEEGKRVYGDVLPYHTADRRLLVVKQPVGVAALITPWNLPSAMVTRKVAPALAAGCTVVLKPAEDTPLSALALGELAQEAGVPPGVFNIVTTATPVQVGEVFTTHPAVRKVSFTGSTRVGKLLMAQCASSVKKISLELGGNAPFIVFDDADLDAALNGLMAVKFRNAGQICISANRIFVQEGIHERFCSRLTDAVSKLRVGHPLEEGTQQGPLINRAALDKVHSLLAEATAAGARITTGGSTHARGGLFFQPTVLTDVTGAMRMSQEEIFGPVAPIRRFRDEAEVIASANDTPYGLAGYFYSSDVGRAWRVAEALEVGMVGINESTLSTEFAPFGGVKESGFGREGSRYGLDDYVDMKFMCFGGIAAKS